MNPINTTNTTFLRIQAIVKADFLLRFRRTSTLLLFVVMCGLAYLVLPDPTSGRTFMKTGSQRVFYSSDAVAVGTVAQFSGIFIALFGFYMLGSTIRRDVDTRTGFVLAATSMRSWEYIAGKFVGNIVFLLALTVGYVAAMMIMYLMRGEEALKPFVFLKIYFLCSFPSIIFVSVMAIVFETIPFLAGKIGNVVYFFVWAAIMTVPAAMGDTDRVRDDEKEQKPIQVLKNEVSWVSYLDATGLAYCIGQVKEQTGSNNFSMGNSPFDASKPPVYMGSIGVPAKWVLPRFVSTVFAMPLLLIALAAFHRFDPVRLKASARQDRRNIIAALNIWLKPISKAVQSLWAVVGVIPVRWTFARSVAAEALMTLSLYPVSIIVWIAITGASLLTPSDSFHGAVLPIIFCVLTVLLADIAIRERSKGMTALLFTTPLLRIHFVWWKFASALVLTFVFLAIPLCRLLLLNVSEGASLAIGGIFLTACAVGMGVMTGTTKTFIGLTMMFFYVVMDSHGQPPEFDFAGWYGTATTSVRGMYLLLTSGVLLVAQVVYAWRLRQRF